MAAPDESLVETKLRSLIGVIEVRENTVVGIACVGPAKTVPPDASPASFLCPNCLREVTAPHRALAARLKGT
jgi:predicted RNA-binding Zn-ribbon protein involved in translation (DUF1610 family)